MVLGVRNLAFLELSTAREGWMQEADEGKVRAWSLD